MRWPCTRREVTGKRVVVTYESEEEEGAQVCHSGVVVAYSSDRGLLVHFDGMYMWPVYMACIYGMHIWC